MLTNWTQMPVLRARAVAPPRLGGVYLIARVQRALGVPLNLEPLYVGRTSRGVGIRLGEHGNLLRSHNRELAEYLATADLSDVEFWFQSVPHEAQAIVERELIIELNPKFNIIKPKRLERQ
jgi:hypothetical protein